MKNLALTIGSFSLIWVYLIVLSIVQVVLCNYQEIFIVVIIIIFLINIFSFLIVWKYVNFKGDSARNRGLKNFSGIYQERKIGVEFIIANLLPLMSMELFTEIEISTFFNNIVVLLILLIIVNHSQNFAFNPYL